MSTFLSEMLIRFALSVITSTAFMQFYREEVSIRDILRYALLIFCISLIFKVLL